jgi:PUA domain protein
MHSAHPLLIHLITSIKRRKLQQKIACVNRCSARSKWFCDDYLYTLDPFLLPHQQVDKGAIKFILSGANIMCPGLTSPGAKLIEADKDAIIVSFYS